MRVRRRRIRWSEQVPFIMKSFHLTKCTFDNAKAKLDWRKCDVNPGQWVCFRMDLGRGHLMTQRGSVACWWIFLGGGKKERGWLNTLFILSVTDWRKKKDTYTHLIYKKTQDPACKREYEECKKSLYELLPTCLRIQTRVSNNADGIFLVCWRARHLERRVWRPRHLQGKATSGSLKWWRATASWRVADGLSNIAPSEDNELKKRRRGGVEPNRMWFSAGVDYIMVQIHRWLGGIKP